MWVEKRTGEGRDGEKKWMMRRRKRRSEGKAKRMGREMAGEEGGE